MANTTLSQHPTPTSHATKFYDLSGEMRNEVYRAYFDTFLEDIWPYRPYFPDDQFFRKDEQKYVHANALRPLVGLFQVSRQVRGETRQWFYTTYFPRFHYILKSRHALYAFTRLPSPWINEYHLAMFMESGALRSREAFNPLKVALYKAAGISVSQIDALAPRPSAFEYNELIHGLQEPIIEIFDTLGVSVTHTKGDQTLQLSVKVHLSGSSDFTLRGRLGLLDFRIVPLMRFADTIKSRRPLPQDFTVPRRVNRASWSSEVRKARALAHDEEMTSFVVDVSESLILASALCSDLRITRGNAVRTWVELFGTVSVTRDGFVRLKPSSLE